MKVVRVLAQVTAALAVTRVAERSTVASRAVKGSSRASTDRCTERGVYTFLGTAIAWGNCLVLSVGALLGGTFSVRGVCRLCDLHLFERCCNELNSWVWQCARPQPGMKKGGSQLLRLWIGLQPATINPGENNVGQMEFSWIFGRGPGKNGGQTKLQSRRY